MNSFNNTLCFYALPLKADPTYSAHICITSVRPPYDCICQYFKSSDVLYRVSAFFTGFVSVFFLSCLLLPVSAAVILPKKLLKLVQSGKSCEDKLCHPLATCIATISFKKQSKYFFLFFQYVIYFKDFGTPIALVKT